MKLLHSKKANKAAETNELSFYLFYRPQEVKWHLMLATCYRKAGIFYSLFELCF